MSDKHWPVLDASLKAADKLVDLSDRRLPHEILRIDAKTAALVFDIDGEDFIATIMRLPLQRKRETGQ